MKLFLSILFLLPALVAGVTSDRDALISVAKTIHNELRAVSFGGLELPGTSIVTTNAEVVATFSSISSAMPSTSVSGVDAFPPVSPGHSNVHSSSYESTNVVLSTVTLVPVTPAGVSGSLQATSPLSAINISKVAVVSSPASVATTTSLAPVSSDLTPTSITGSSSAQSSVVKSSKTPTLPIQSLEIRPTPLGFSTAQHADVQFSTASSLSSQSISLESFTVETTKESVISQVSAAPSDSMSSDVNAPFVNSTTSLVQSSSLTLAISNSVIVSVTSVSNPSVSVIVGTPQSYYGSIPSNKPTYSNASSSAVSGIVGTLPSNSADLPTNTPTYSNSSSSGNPLIVGTPESIASSGSPSAPAFGTPQTSSTSTTTTTSTTTRTGTITRTMTDSSAGITSQTLIGKLPVTEAPSGLTTETLISGGSTWTTTEIGPASTITASLMLNPQFSASINGGVNTDNGAVSSGACTCPSQVTVTVTATPFIVTGGTFTGTSIGSTTSANSPEDSTSSSPASTTYAAPPQESSDYSSASTTYAAPPQESSDSSPASTTYPVPDEEPWTTHSIRRSIGVTISSSSMPYPSHGTSYAASSMEPSISAPNPDTTPTISGTGYNTQVTPSAGGFSNYSSTSTGSLLGTDVNSVGTGTAVLQTTYAPSFGLPPVPTPSSALFTGNADVNTVSSESIALVVGFFALVLLV